MTTCGMGDEQSCCASLEVAGGMYNRAYVDTTGKQLGTETNPATVSSFRLDAYLVTVGRFRQFVKAVNPTASGPGTGGWMPASMSGKHAHLNAGKGLVSSLSTTTFEPGWAVADTANIAPTDANLTCDTMSATWTPSAGVNLNETRPINCVNWYEAYAFCIWDGGFLPSDAEWEYAAAGGSMQLEYPWGAMDPRGNQQSSYAISADDNADCTYPPPAAACSGLPNIAPVGTATLGAARWGQLDMAGDVSEWTLDDQHDAVASCDDCVDLSASGTRVIRGGAFDTGLEYLRPGDPSVALAETTTTRMKELGFRCARVP